MGKHPRSSGGAEYERLPSYSDYLADYNSRRSIATQSQRDDAQARRFAQLSRRRDALAAAGATGLPDISPHHSAEDMNNFERRLNGYAQDPSTGKVRPATRAEIAAGRAVDPEQLASLHEARQSGAAAAPDDSWYTGARSGAASSVSDDVLQTIAPNTARALNGQAPASGPVTTPRPAAPRAPVDPLTGLPQQGQPSALAAQRDAARNIADPLVGLHPGAPLPYGKIGQTQTYSDPLVLGSEAMRRVDPSGATRIRTAAGGSVTIPAAQPQTAPANGGSGIYVDGQDQTASLFKDLTSQGRQERLASGLPVTAPAAGMSPQDWAATQAVIASHYPKVGVAGSPENKQFADAFRAGGGNREGALELAHSLFRPGASYQTAPVQGVNGTAAPAYAGDVRLAESGQDNAAARAQGEKVAAQMARENQPSGVAAAQAVRGAVGGAVNKVGGALDATGRAVNGATSTVSNFARTLVGAPLSNASDPSTPSVVSREPAFAPRPKTSASEDAANMSAWNALIAPPSAAAPAAPGVAATTAARPNDPLTNLLPAAAPNASAMASRPTGASLALDHPTSAAQALIGPTPASAALAGPTSAASALNKPTAAASALTKPTGASLALENAPAGKGPLDALVSPTGPAAAVGAPKVAPVTGPKPLSSSVTPTSSTDPLVISPESLNPKVPATPTTLKPVDPDELLRRRRLAGVGSLGGLLGS